MTSARLRSTTCAAALVLGGLLAGVPSLALASPRTAVPHTDVVGDAQAQATALRLRVASLRQQAEQATEDYDAAYDELGRSITAQVAAQRELRSAQDAAGAIDGLASARVRALYMSGGSAGLYASVLTSDDLPEALRRMHEVGVVLVGDQRAAARAQDGVQHQVRAEAAVAAAAQASSRLQATVAQRADAVRGLLADADTLLAQADVRVRVLAQQQEQADEAAAAGRAAATMAQLQAAARANPEAGDLPGSVPGDLPPGTGASPVAAAAISFARAQLGKPYVWGATGPGSYDCSGLTGAAYAAAGISLPRTSRQQWYAGPHVSVGDLQPGDLLFWASNASNPATIHHVALYIGNARMIAAPHSGTDVQIESVYFEGYLGAIRPLPRP